MNATSRQDFFTVIHKGQRNELFAATVLAGTINWEDTIAANDFVALWSKLTSMLEAHAAHEHKHKSNGALTRARKVPRSVSPLGVFRQSVGRRPMSKLCTLLSTI